MRHFIKRSIEILKEFEPDEGYWLAFSGGKDSIVMRHLADRAKVKYIPFYNVTTIDPPEVIYFMRKYHSDITWMRPKVPFLKRLFYHGFPPLRHQRWCCAEFKESFKPDGSLLMGLRHEESVNRKSRKVYEKSRTNDKCTIINPILDWSSEDVWRYIIKENIPYCSLYNGEWHRIGCLFCPNATRRERILHAQTYPKFEKAFIKAFIKLYEHRKKKGKLLNKWDSGEELFRWWLHTSDIKGDPYIDGMFKLKRIL